MVKVEVVIEEINGSPTVYVAPLKDTGYTAMERYIFHKFSAKAKEFMEELTRDFGDAYKSSILNGNITDETVNKLKQDLRR